MQKALTFIALSMLILSAATLHGAIYKLEGQVTSGFSLFPPPEQVTNVPFEEFGIPAGGFPIDFEATLELGEEPTDWSFEFMVTDDERSVEYLISWPRQSSNNSRFDKNNVVVLPGQITIDFNVFATFSERFSLQLDLNTGTGQWDWAQFCPVCDLLYSLPAATATVTSIRVIPEPSSLLIAALAGIISLATSRRR